MCGRFPYPDEVELEKKVRKEIPDRLEHQARYDTAPTGMYQSAPYYYSIFPVGFDTLKMKDGKYLPKK